MHLVPLALGVLAILIGIAMIAFGIPINEFGTGNTLIAAGTPAVVGGFILLGLWVGVLQLQRLVGALEPRSARAARGRGEVAASDLDHARRQLEAEDAGLAPLREPLPATEETAERGPARHSSEQPAERTSWLPPLEEPEPRIRERPGAGGDEHLETREKASSWELFAPSRTSSPARERSF